MATTKTTSSNSAAGVPTVERLCRRTVGQLRLAYERLADEPPAARAAQLGDVVRDALTGVPADQRMAFLDGLRGHFPTWDAKADAAPTVAAIAAADAERRAERAKIEAGFEAKLNDPAFLVQRLTALGSAMPEPQRRQVASQLAKTYPPSTPTAAVAGASQSPAPAPSVAAASAVKPAPKPLEDGDGALALRRVLSIPSNQPIDSNRVAISLALLFDLTTSIDEVAWGVWDAMVSAAQEQRPNLRRRLWLKPTLTRLIVGGPGTALGEVEPAVDELRGLTAGLLNAVRDGPKLAEEPLGKLNPERIEESVRQGGFSMRSLEARCWEQYRARHQEALTQVQASVARNVVASVDFFRSGAQK